MLFLSNACWLVLMKQLLVTYISVLVYISFFLAKSHSHRQCCQWIHHYRKLLIPILYIHILYMCVHTIHPLPHTYSHSSVRNAALQSRHAKVYLGLLYNLRYRLIHSSFPEYHSAPCHFLAACSFLPLSFSLFIPTLPLSTAHLSSMTTFKAFCFHVDT